MLVRFLGNAIAILLLPYILQGIEVHGVGAAIVAALLWGLVNAVIRPVLNLLTLPLNVLTLGLFGLVVNALLFWLVGSVVSGFVVHGFWPAFFGSILMGLLSSLFSYFVK
ncbi:MAG: phage holin family protein [Brockia lithotrophica]|nr:phage holin family protein [Brockia lithotrophica]